MNIIKVNIDFEQGICRNEGISVVTGDYNSTKVVFEFNDSAIGTKIFEMKNPKNELVYVDEIIDNEVVLVGYEEENGETTAYSLFGEEGDYTFEVSLYQDDGKLTSVCGYITADKEQVIVDGEEVQEKITLFDDLMNDLSTKIEEANNLDVDAEKVDKTATITVTKKDGTSHEVEVLDGKSIEYDWEGTSLGIRQEGESDYNYVNLQGPKGDKGEKGDKGDKGEVDTSNYYTKTEVDNLIPTELNELNDDSTHRVVTDTQINSWNSKVDTSDLSTVATSGSYNDLSNKPTIPTNTSQLTNNSGFITKDVNDLTYYTLATNTGSYVELEINTTNYVATLSLKNSSGTVISSDSIDLPLESVVVSGAYNDSGKKIVLTLQNGNTIDIPVGDLIAGLQTEITSSNKIASDLVNDSNSANKFVTTSEKTTWNGKQNAITSSNKLSASLVSGLSTVATSGSYNDLSDKPTIPTQVTESTVSGWGFTKNTGTYIKPSTGIPKTDLASGVQTSLGKADTALQSISSNDVTTALGYTPYNSTNPNGYTSNTGTITGVKMNGSTVTSSGVADLGTVITAHQDISGKQDKILAGTNISIASDGKTISATDTTYSNATTTTAGLMSSDDKTKLNGIETGATKNLNYYGTCATAAATQAKVVVCEGFVLEEGATISVLFTNAQTYNGVPTLNVNSTGAINVRYKADTNAVRYIWSAGEIIDFTYDGTYWVMHRSALASTTYYGLAKYSDSLISTSSLALTTKGMNTAMINIISGTPVYSASSTYDVGDRVRYSNNVWECVTAITAAESWTAAHWQTVAPLQEQIDDKQDVLVSGTNIKTINNQSVLGSGNITIESVTIDTAMSDSSTNAVQNRVIKSYVDNMVGDIESVLTALDTGSGV